MKINWAGVLGPLVSLFDKEAREATTRLARGIPADSLLRKELFERLFDGARQALEKMKFDNEVLEMLWEKLIDYGDYFAVTLYGRDTASGKVKGAKEASVVAGSAWMNKFFEDARERLRNAADKPAEAEKVQIEFQLNLQVLRAMQDALKAMEPELPQEPEPEPIDWAAFGEKLKELLIGLGNGALKVGKWADGKLVPVADWLEQRQGAKS